MRKDCPLIVGRSQTGTLIASDVPAILKYTRDVYYIDNMEVVRLTENDIRFFNMDLEEVQKESVHIAWDAEAAEKSGYEHFMIKEIHEEPRAVQDTLGSACGRMGAVTISICRPMASPRRRSAVSTGCASWPVDPLTTRGWWQSM